MPVVGAPVPVSEMMGQMCCLIVTVQASFQYDVAGQYSIVVRIAGSALRKLHVVRVIPGAMDLDSAQVTEVSHGRTGDILTFKARRPRHCHISTHPPAATLPPSLRLGSHLHD